jgi:N-methylhydantoinase A/oxoprolinase/acetone carboxylase beta subunit
LFIVIFTHEFLQILLCTSFPKGAALIANACNVFVVDIGGTTTDVGFLDTRSRPRLSQIDVNIGGVVLNARIPDVKSIALGGGTLVDDVSGGLSAASVGYRLSTEARVFGGTATTLTDVAVATGRCVIGDPTFVASLRDRPTLVNGTMQCAIERIERLIDESKTSNSKKNHM